MKNSSSKFARAVDNQSGPIGPSASDREDVKLAGESSAVHS